MSELTALAIGVLVGLTICAAACPFNSDNGDSKSDHGGQIKEGDEGIDATKIATPNPIDRDKDDD
jgi:hypothetical protein